jgi:hypothetical protein
MQFYSECRPFQYECQPRGKCRRKKKKQGDDALERFPNLNAIVEQDSQPGLFRNMRVEALIDAAIA